MPETEIVYALGQEHRSVGRDTTSGCPFEAEGLLVVGYLRRLSPEGVLSVNSGFIVAEDALDLTTPLHSWKRRMDHGCQHQHCDRWIIGLAGGAKTTYIEPGAPLENGYYDSSNARVRDELLNDEIFCSSRQAQILIEV